MKTMTYEVGALAFVLPIPASTSGAFQGTGLPSGTAAGTSGLLGGRRDRSRITGTHAPGSVVRGPVI